MWDQVTAQFGSTAATTRQAEASQSGDDREDSAPRSAAGAMNMWTVNDHLGGQ